MLKRTLDAHVGKLDKDHLPWSGRLLDQVQLKPFIEQIMRGGFAFNSQCSMGELQRNRFDFRESLLLR